MERVLIAVAIVAVAVAVSFVMRRSRRVDSPTQARGAVPVQLDRKDFPGADSEWLLAVFTSATCDTCADVVRKAQVAASVAVAVTEVEWTANRDLHERYGIDAVPVTVLADRAGVVRASFVGPVSATDLWATIASARGD